MTTPGTEATAAEKPPVWRDVRVLRIVGQLVFLAAVAGLGFWLLSNLRTNLSDSNLPTGWGYLEQPAGFGIAGSSFRPTQSNWDAILVGLKNTILVSLAGIVFATIIGVIVGVGRLSTNVLVRSASAVYVETFRNIPVLVLIIFLTLSVVFRLPRLQDSLEPGGVMVVSNNGIWLPWFTGRDNLQVFWVFLIVAVVAAVAVAVWRTSVNERTGVPHHRVMWAVAVFLLISTIGYVVTGQAFTVTTPTRDVTIVTGGLRIIPEYLGLLAGLSIYTASHIAEIVRGSMQAVPKGQTEAAQAVALSGFQRLRFVILPQAFRIAVPPVGNQYLNLMKNSSLAVAIGYPELTQITTQIIGNGRPAPQNIAVLMAIYLALSLTISLVINLVNRRLQVVER